MSIRLLNSDFCDIRKISLALVSFLCFPAVSYGQIIDDFENSDIKTNHGLQVWSQYEGDPNHVPGHPDRGVASITTDDSFEGDRSMKVDLENGNLYLQFYTHNGSNWNYMHELLSSWQFNTYDRVKVWIKVPSGIPMPTNGTHNMAVGTYCREWGADRQSAETNCGHYYHYFKIMLTDVWYQMIIDTHPTHMRGSHGGIDQDNREFPTGNQSYNYFDLMTRFYFDFNGMVGDGSQYPVQYYVDSIEAYSADPEENIDQIYSLSGGSS